MFKPANPRHLSTDLSKPSVLSWSTAKRPPTGVEEFRGAVLFTTGLLSFFAVIGVIVAVFVFSVDFWVAMAARTLPDLPRISPNLYGILSLFICATVGLSLIMGMLTYNSGISRNDVFHFSFDADTKKLDVSYVSDGYMRKYKQTVVDFDDVELILPRAIDHRLPNGYLWIKLRVAPYSVGSYEEINYLDKVYLPWLKLQFGERLAEMEVMSSD